MLLLLMMMMMMMMMRKTVNDVALETRNPPPSKTQQRLSMSGNDMPTVRLPQRRDTLRISRKTLVRQSLRTSCSSRSIDFPFAAQVVLCFLLTSVSCVSNAIFSFAGFYIVDVVPEITETRNAGKKAGELSIFDL